MPRQQTLSAPFLARRKALGPPRPATLGMGVMTVFYAVVLLLPLYSLFSKAFLNPDGSFAGLANYVEYFSTPALSVSIRNTVVVSVVSALLGTALGFGNADGLIPPQSRGLVFLRSVAVVHH